MPKRKGRQQLHSKEPPSQGQKKGTPPKLQKCPGCGEMTLYWDKCTNQGVCLNFNCKLSAR